LQAEWLNEAYDDYCKLQDGDYSIVCSVFQALLANISAMYAVYHGPNGLKEIGCNVHNAACLLALGNVTFSF